MKRITTPRFNRLINPHNMKSLHRITFVLVIIGALNLGLVGIGNYIGSPSLDVLTDVFGPIPWLLNLVDVIIGLSALVLIFDHKNTCRMCGSGPSTGTGKSATTGTGM